MVTSELEWFPYSDISWLKMFFSRKVGYGRGMCVGWMYVVFLFYSVYFCLGAQFLCYYFIHLYYHSRVSKSVKTIALYSETKSKIQ